MPHQVNTAVHFPINFLRLSSVRMLNSLLVVLPKLSVSGLDMAARLVFEFAESGESWRKLAKPRLLDVLAENRLTAADLANEPVVAMVELYCDWRGEPGGLVVRALVAEFLVLEQRGEDVGVACPVFAAYNPHLLPGFRTRQEKGGAANSARVGARQAAKEVESMLKLKAARQESLPLSEDAATEEEVEQAFSLLMQLDRACGSQMRKVAELEGDVEEIELAVEAVRTATLEDRMKVLAAIIARRGDPTQVKNTKRILIAWPNYLSEIKDK